MFIYLATFTASAVCLYYHEKKKKNTSIYLYLAILIPSVIAGLRAISVGTDVSLYGKYIYDQAVNSNQLTAFLSAQTMVDNKDIGFNILVFVLSRFFKDYHWGLFFYQFIALIFVYMGIKRISSFMNTCVWFPMLLYYLFLYNISLNIMRQSIAIAILVFAISYLFEHKFKKMLIWGIVAISFHSSALFGMLVFPMYLILSPNRKKDKQMSETKQIMQCIILLFVAVIGIIFFEAAINQLVEIGVLRANYLKYLSGGMFSNRNRTVSISIKAILPSLCFAGFSVFNHRRMNRRVNDNLFLTMNSILVFISCFGPLLADYVIRIGYYLIPLQLVTMTAMDKCFEKKSRLFWRLIVLVIALYYWGFNIALMNYNETLPYLFMWK